MTSLPVNLSRACEIVGYANTPYYLFKHLRAEGFLYQTAASFASTDSLLNRLRDDIERPITKPEDLAEIYILLLSLAFKPPADYAATLESLHAEHVEWFEELKAIALALARPTLQVTYEVRPMPTVTLLGGRL